MSIDSMQTEKLERSISVSDIDSGYSSPYEGIKNWNLDHRRYDALTNARSSVTTQLSCNEIDAEPVLNDCLEKGNIVDMIVNMDGTVMYLAVNKQQQIVVQPRAIPDDKNVLFIWKNLKNTDFGLILQNDSLYEGRVIGIENFVNNEPLTLQLQDQSSNNYVLYRRGSSKNGYFSLCLKSPDDKFFYILPSEIGKPLRIHSVDQIKEELKDRNFYVFNYTTVKCSNSEGSCQFQRLTG